jgi:hypothetical protein
MVFHFCLLATVIGTRNSGESRFHIDGNELQRSSDIKGDEKSPTSVMKIDDVLESVLARDKFRRMIRKPTSNPAHDFSSHPTLRNDVTTDSKSLDVPDDVEVEPDSLVAASSRDSFDDSDTRNRASKEIKRAISQLLQALTQDDIAFILAQEPRPVEVKKLSRVVREALLQHRPDLAMKFAKAARETLLAYLTDCHFRVYEEREARGPLPRLGAFIAGMVEVYFEIMEHRIPNFRVLENAILVSEMWAGPICF